LAVLVELVETEGKLRSKSLGLHKKTRVVSESAWRTACKKKKIGEPNSPDSAKTALRRARDALVKRGLVMRVGDYVYVAPDKE
jgi:hypothetical protein